MKVKRKLQLLLSAVIVTVSICVVLNLVYFSMMNASSAAITSDALPTPNIGNVLASMSWLQKRELVKQISKEPLKKSENPTLNIPLSLKNIIPQKNNEVDIVFSMNLQKFFKVIDASIYGHPNGEMTPHSPPMQVDFVMHNPDICSRHGDNLDTIIYVHSAPLNTKRRTILRNTWANRSLFKDNRTEVVFMVGTPLDNNEQTILSDEFQKYGDIVQGGFTEHYNNLTLKAVMGLKWISKFCSNTRFALKADDDAFVNIFTLMKTIGNRKFSANTESNLLACPLWKKNTMPILRDPEKCMKWCVRFDEFPGKTHFPQYCAGLSFLMGTKLVDKLYKNSINTPFFWIDDIYITGILAEKIEELHTVDFLSNFTLKEDVAKEQYMKNDEPTLIFGHVKKAENFYSMWKRTLEKLDPESKSKVNYDKALQAIPSD